MLPGMVRFSCLENLLCQVEFLQRFSRQTSGPTPVLGWRSFFKLEPCQNSLTCTLSQNFGGDKEELILHQPWDLNLSAKGLHDRNSPTCTLSQNGYGVKELLAHQEQSLRV